MPAEITSGCVRNVSADSNEASIDGGDGREGGASGDGDCADIVDAVGPREIQSGGPITVVKCVVCLVRAYIKSHSVELTAPHIVSNAL